MAWLHGHVPYRDVWNHSLPGGFVFAALVQVFAGTSTIALRIADLVLVSTAAYAIVRFLLRFCAAWIAWWAGALLVLGYVGHGDFWHTTQRDGYILAPMLWSFWLARERRGVRTGVAAGVLIGLAALCKPGALATIALVGWYRQRDRAAVIAVLVGAAFPLALFGVILLVSGALHGFVESVIEFNRGYASLLGASVIDHLAALWRIIRTFLLTTRLELSVSLLVVFAPASLRPLRAAAIAALLAALCVPVAQAAAYPYHLLPLLGPLTLLSGLGLECARLRLTSASPAVGRITTIALALALALVPARRWFNHASHFAVWASGGSQEAYLDAFSTRDYNSLEVVHISEFMREHSSTDDTVQVWGPDAVFLLLSGRQAATRYHGLVPLAANWTLRRERPRFMAALRAHPPRYFVVERGDMMPWLTGNRSDSATMLIQYPELFSWVRASYHPVQASLHVLVLERGSATSSPPQPRPAR